MAPKRQQRSGAEKLRMKKLPYEAHLNVGMTVGYPNFKTLKTSSFYEGEYNCSNTTALW